MTAKTKAYESGEELAKSFNECFVLDMLTPGDAEKFAGKLGLPLSELGPNRKTRVAIRDVIQGFLDHGEKHFPFTLARIFKVKVEIQ